jgi:hypothetical protein
MNTGLQDAYNLCWKLAMVLKRQAAPSLLDTYNEERLPFARWLLRFTDRMFNAMTSDNWFLRWVRKNIAFNLVGFALVNSSIRPRIFKVISQIWYSYAGKTLSRSLTRQRLSISAGDRLPFFSEGNIYPLFTDGCFHLLHVNTEPLAAHVLQRLNALFPFPVKTVEQKLSDNWLKLGVTGELFLLVRPDNYISFISDYWNEAAAEFYLGRHFRPQVP